MLKQEVMGNNDQSRFSIVTRIRSFSHAFAGLKVLLKEEHNARIHLFASVLALVAGFVYSLSTIEWVAVLMAIALVFISEIINSAIEGICDFICPQQNDGIKKIKDLAAAAVLFSAVIAIAIGVLVFWSKVF